MDKATATALGAVAGLVVAGLVGLGVYAAQPEEDAVSDEESDENSDENSDDDADDDADLPPPVRTQKDAAQLEPHEAEPLEPEEDADSDEDSDVRTPVRTQKDDDADDDSDEESDEEPQAPSRASQPRQHDTNDRSYMACVLFVLLTLAPKFTRYHMVNYYNDSRNEIFDDEDWYPQTCKQAARRAIAAYLGGLLKPNAVINEDVLNKFTELLSACPRTWEAYPEQLLNQLFSAFLIRRNAHKSDGSQADDLPYYLTGDFLQHAAATDPMHKDANKVRMSGSFGPDMAVVYLPRVHTDRKEMTTVELSRLHWQLSHGGGVTQRYNLLAVIVHTKDSHYVVQYPVQDVWYQYDYPGAVTQLGSYKDVLSKPYNPDNSGVLFFFMKGEAGMVSQRPRRR